MQNRVAPHLDLDYPKSHFWPRVAVGEPNECWPWSQSIGSHGYGQAWDGITVRLAHRCAWELTHGRIPGGLTIDHICRTRRCCNPAHLRLLTNLDNATDNGQSRRTHCPKGHPYSGDNLYVDPKGHRRCRACAADGRVRHGTPNAAKTHCPKGHPYEGNNLYTTPSGHRRCRTCNRERGRKK